MRNLWIIAALLVFAADGPLLFAQSVEDSHAQATDALSATLFLYNPAGPQPHEARGSLGAAVPRAKDRDGTILGAAYSTGGSDKSSYGVRAEVTRFTDGSNSAAGEDDGLGFTGRYAAAHYGMQVAGILRLGLLAQIHDIQADAVRFGDGVTSKASGLLIGGAAGAFLGSEKGGVGVAYYPGARGAAEAEGEHRILGESQRLIVESVFAWSQKLTLGLTAQTAKEPDGLDADVSALETPTGTRPVAVLAAGYQMKHADRWLHRLTWQRENYDEGGVDPKGEVLDGVRSPWATWLKLQFGRESAGSCQSYIGVTTWLRDLDTLSQVTYLGMLSFAL